MTTLSRLAATLSVVAVAGGAGFIAYRSLRPLSSLEAETHPISSPATTAAQAAALTPRAIPDRLPDFVLTDSKGVPRRLADWEGRPLMVNFWATWCAPCRREIPLLQALRAERSADRVEVIGIAVDFRDAVLEYAQEIGLAYPLLIGENDGLAAVEAFGMESVFPFTVFADTEHRIVTVKVGELHRDEAEYILDRVREIDASRLALDAAQQQIAAKLRELSAKRQLPRPDRRRSAQKVP